MFKRKIDFNKVNDFNQRLENILQEVKNTKISDIFEPAYSDLSKYFIQSKEKKLEYLVNKGLFPPSSSDYIIENGVSDDIKMPDAPQLFYMKGVYVNRRHYSEDNYFGLKLDGKILKVAYTKNNLNGKLKVYIDYTFLDRIDDKKLKKLLIASGFAIANYNNANNSTKSYNKSK